MDLLRVIIPGQTSDQTIWVVLPGRWHMTARATCWQAHKEEDFGVLRLMVLLGNA